MRKNVAVDELLSCRFVTQFLQVGQISVLRLLCVSFSCKESVGESEDCSEEGYNCTATVRRKLIIITLLFEES